MSGPEQHAKPPDSLGGHVKGQEVLQLAPGVFLARIDRRSVVLDLGRDRYTGLNERLTLALTGQVATAAGSSNPELAGALRQLKSAGILSTMAPPLPIRQAGPPTHSLWPSPPPFERFPAFQARQAGAALVALARISLSLRTAPIRTTVEQMRRTIQFDRGRRPRIGVLPILDGYTAARPWFPVRPICRLEALVLAHLFARAGHRPALVFGVRLDPFHAHCWVQLDECVVNEPVENVRQYTPIMTLRRPV